MSLTRNIVGCWSPSLGASGYLLRDVSGRNNHGTLTNMDPGTDWVASPAGLMLNCNGVSGSVVIGRSPVWQFGQRDFTVAIWFVSADSSGFEALIAKDEFSSRNWLIGYGASGENIQFFDYVSLEHCFSSVDPIIGQLYHTVITRQSTLITIYVNGVESGTKVQSQVTNYAGDTQTSFASRLYSGFPQFFNGRLGEIACFGRALAPAEASELYQRGNGWLGRELTGMNQRRTYGKKLGNRRRRLLCGGMT